MSLDTSSAMSLMVVSSLAVRVINREATGDRVGKASDSNTVFRTTVLFMRIPQTEKLIFKGVICPQNHY